MSKVSGSFTLASTGTGIGITGLGINPTKLRFRIGARNDSSSNVQVYDGSVDSSGYSGCTSSFDDGTNRESKVFDANTRCIYVREFSGGAWVTRIDASFNSYVTGGFKLNVAAADPNFSVWVDAEN